MTLNLNRKVDDFHATKGYRPTTLVAGLNEDIKDNLEEWMKRLENGTGRKCLSKDDLWKKCKLAEQNALKSPC